MPHKLPNDLKKSGNEKNIWKLDGDTVLCPVSPPKVNPWQKWPELTQKQISKFSGLVQFCLIFLVLVKYFATDCSWTKSLPVFRYIPSKIIKENTDIFTDYLYSSFNNSIYQSEFLSILKLENIAPVFKKSDRNSKENCRPVSILSKISKNFERYMFRQIFNFMNSDLAKQQYGFTKAALHNIAC